MIQVKPIGVTQPLIQEIPDHEGIMAYCARVSNPSNQNQFDTADKLLGYCARNDHWSVFETTNLVMEIECPRDIARQILRHRSFSFQEFSQRYAEATQFCEREARLQDTMNRQNSVVTSDNLLKFEWQERQQSLLVRVKEDYEWALKNGIAKECARVILPEGLTMSRLYMNGTVRSWMHYINLRKENGTQAEHREVAIKARGEFVELFPSLEEYV